MRSAAPFSVKPQCEYFGVLTGAAGRLQVLEGLTALCMSVVICFLGTSAAAAYSMSSQSITVITGITVCLATVVPRVLAPYIHAGERLAGMLMQVTGALTAVFY